MYSRSYWLFPSNGVTLCQKRFLMILFIFRVQCSGFLFRVIVIAINTLVLFGNMKRKIVFITEYLSVFMVLNCSFSFLLTFLHIQVIHFTYI
jgi:hypothetical protein